MAAAHSEPAPSTGSPSDRPFQFTLRQAAIAVTIVSLLMALIFQWGLMGLVILVAAGAILAMCWGAYWNDGPWFGAGCLVLAVDWFVLLPIPLALAEQEEQRHWRCKINLKQIAMSLHNYHDVYGSFPPAYVADAAGKPMHSWRVLILPFTEETALYARYNFNEPWDGPNNILLANEMPDIFRCQQCDAKQATGVTNYLAIVGPKSAWEGARAVSLGEFSDGTSSTLLVVESHGTGVCWLAPQDLDAARLPCAVNSKGCGICGPHHRREHAYCNVATADGGVHEVDGELPPDRLQALITIAGGEKVKPP
jgi:hypothetical protein